MRGNRTSDWCLPKRRMAGAERTYRVTFDMDAEYPTGVSVRGRASVEVVARDEANAIARARARMDALGLHHADPRVERMLP